MDATSEMEQKCDWAEELKRQLDAAGAILRAEGDEAEESPVTLQLSSPALEMLASAIDDLLRSGGASTGTLAASTPADDIADLIDGSMAAWRSQIELSLAESATRQLESQLEQVASLSSAMLDREKLLAERESRVEAQTSKLHDELAASLRIQSRTERQRKTLAAGFRRQRAEQRLAMANDIFQRQTFERQESEQLAEELRELRADLKESNAQRDDLNQRTESLRQRESELLAEVATLKEQLATQEISAANNSTDELELELRQLEEDNARLEEALGDQREKLEEEMDAENARLLQTISKLSANVEELEKQASASEELTEQLLQAEAELEKLRIASTNAPEDLSEQLGEAKEQIEQLQLQLAEQEQMLAQAGDDDSKDPENTTHLAELEQQIADFQERVKHLEEENRRLAATENSIPPGGNRPHMNFKQESLSWEERKKLIMDQLEHDDSPQTSEAHAATLEIESILQTTQAEIERRDRDIKELQSIIEQQSDTKQGVAIGAAAIAQMFDDDELVVQEREKLKTLQSEWEDKVRQAEIDISMERAKLARQRSEVETKVAELESQLAKHGGSLPPPPDGEAAGGRTRKWLEHLGLKDDPS